MSVKVQIIISVAMVAALLWVMWRMEDMPTKLIVQLTILVCVIDTCLLLRHQYERG